MHIKTFLFTLIPALTLAFLFWRFAPRDDKGAIKEAAKVLIFCVASASVIAAAILFFVTSTAPIQII